MSLDDFISKEKVMAGSVTKRATTLLFLIETLTAHLKTQSAQTLDELHDDHISKENKLAFLQAFTLAKETTDRPTIQQLEQFSSSWAYLVPDNPRHKAALAQQLGKKYRFNMRVAPGICACLGANNPEVQTAFQEAFQQPIETIYTPRLSLRDSLGWRWTAFARWLSSLSPFWATVVLSVTLAFPQAFLALPIAIAGVGPWVGVAILAGLGVLNLLTVACLAEAVTRSGIIRYGNAFTGQLVGSLLGKIGATLITLVLTLSFFLGLLSSFIGLSTTLDSFTLVPDWVWVGLFFLTGLYLLGRKPVTFTLSLTVLLGLLTIGLTVVIAILIAPRFDAANLVSTATPSANGWPFQKAALGLLIGTCFGFFCLQNYIVQIGGLVLPRETSGKSFIKGSMLATFFSTVFACGWVILVCGVVGPSKLTGQKGTVLPLLAGNNLVLSTLCSGLAIFTMGLTALSCLLVLFRLVSEQLPRKLENSSAEAAKSQNLWTKIGQHPVGRFVISVSPLIGVAALAEILIVTGSQSFTGLLSFTGVIVRSLIIGIFPALLLVAAQRKGERLPAMAFWFLGHPVVAGLIYLLFLGNLFLHGLVIWEQPIQQVCALLMAAIVIWATVRMIREGVFKPRVVLELRREQSVLQRSPTRSTYSVVAHGKPLPVEVNLVYNTTTEHLQAASANLERLDKLRTANFQLKSGKASQLKVWVHVVTPEGFSESIPARLELKEPAGEVRQFDLKQHDGQLILSLAANSNPDGLELTLSGLAQNDLKVNKDLRLAID